MASLGPNIGTMEKQNFAVKEQLSTGAHTLGVMYHLG